MSDTKISDAVVKVACEAWLAEAARMRGGDNHCMRAALTAALPHLHPQPAELAEQQGAEVQLPEFGINTANHAGIRIRGYTAEQMQDYARAALAATGKQQVGEVQGDVRAQFEAWHCEKFKTRWQTGAPTRDMHNGVYAENYAPAEQQVRWEAWQAAWQGALAARQPGCSCRWPTWFGGALRAAGG